MYLLDTNTVSELRKVAAGKAHPAVTRWITAVAPSALYTSVITIEELQIGMLRLVRRDAVQGTLLRRWISEQVLPAFANRILPVDLAVAECSARMQVPDPRPVRDAYIAATAVVHGLTVVTRNVGDFTACGARVLNPWLAPE